MTPVENHSELQCFYRRPLTTHFLSVKYDHNIFSTLRMVLSKQTFQPLGINIYILPGPGGKHGKPE